MKDRFKIIYCKSEMKGNKHINKYYSINIEGKEEAKAIAKATNGIITIIK